MRLFAPTTGGKRAEGAKILDIFVHLQSCKGENDRRRRNFWTAGGENFEILGPGGQKTPPPPGKEPKQKQGGGARLPARVEPWLRIAGATKHLRSLSRKNIHHLFIIFP